MKWAVSALVFLPVLAGCLTNPAQDLAAQLPATPPAGEPRLGLGPRPLFSLPQIVDDVRAGGEPVIAVTAKGTLLVSSHPGYTHAHPDRVAPQVDHAVAPTQGQSYLWRSEDGGKTWQHVSLLGAAGGPSAGPRGPGLGLGDPEFAIDGNGRIWFTDLEALAQASLSWSDDDGKTWLYGNNVFSGAPMDRQWLAAYEEELFFTGNFFTDHRVLVTKNGVTSERRGNYPCAGDLVAHPTLGVLYGGCADSLAVSKDGGKTWATRKAPIKPPPQGGVFSVPSEPALDASGTIYLARGEEAKEIRLVWTRDEGETWQSLALTQYFPELTKGTAIWPWASAGSEGRVSVTFWGSPKPRAEDDPQAPWFVYNVILLGSTGPAPEVYPTKLTPTPFHTGAICIGTACQATTATDPRSDRRLGDFFETTIDKEGILHVVYADTASQPRDSVSHVAYVRLLDGPRLVAGELPMGFPTQG